MWISLALWTDLNFDMKPAFHYFYQTLANIIYNLKFLNIQNKLIK